MTIRDEDRRVEVDPRALGLLMAEIERLRDLVTRASNRAAGEPSARALPPDLSTDEQRLVGLLRRVREVALGRPAVGHAITSFLVAEGRRFAVTEEGAAWLATLRRAPEVERLRQIWEATTLNVFDDTADGVGVPDAWVDVIADLASIEHVNRIVTALLPEGLA